MEKLDVMVPEVIERRILLLRGLKVMLDAHLAELYGVSTKRLNEQVRRNRKRFPVDFMFQLRKDEADEVPARMSSRNKGQLTRALMLH